MKWSESHDPKMDIEDKDVVINMELVLLNLDRLVTGNPCDVTCL